MRLAVFKKYQEESDKPFMCANPDHTMPLVAVMNDDLTIHLKCFADKCGFALRPGLLTYKEIIEKNLNV